MTWWSRLQVKKFASPPIVSVNQKPSVSLNTFISFCPSLPPG